MRIVRPAIWTSIACTILAAAGCGSNGDSLQERATTRKLPNGAVVVSNPAALDHEVRPLTVDLRFGREAGAGQDLFGNVADLEVDAYGRIYVLDDQAREFRVFGADGAHVRTIGGRGSGPLEFSRPTGIAWGPDWQMWIEDTGNNRYSVFDTTGALLASHPRKFSWRAFRWSGAFDRDGNLYLENMKFSVEQISRWLTKGDTDLAVTDSIQLPQFEPATYELVLDGIKVAVTNIPFTPNLRWSVAPDGTLWFGLTDAYRFYQRAMEGDTLRIVERAYNPIPISQSVRDSALDTEFLRDMAERGANIDPSLVPKHLPRWQSFTIDDEDRLWVMPQLAAPDSSAFDMYDSKGRLVASFKLGARLVPSTLRVRADYLYGVMVDELDVPYVIRASVHLPD